MRYVDAEKLVTKIKELNLVTKTYEEQVAFNNALAMVVETIDSLQQEQPESSNGKFMFPNFLYARTVDNKTIDVSYAPQSIDAVEYVKNDPTEQPEVDFEEILDKWRHDHFNGKRDGHYSGEYLERKSQMDLARYCFELGKKV